MDSRCAQSSSLCTYIVDVNKGSMDGWWAPGPDRGDGHCPKGNNPIIILTPLPPLRAYFRSMTWVSFWFWTAGMHFFCLPCCQGSGIIIKGFWNVSNMYLRCHGMTSLLSFSISFFFPCPPPPSPPSDFVQPCPLALQLLHIVGGKMICYRTQPGSEG